MRVCQTSSELLLEIAKLNSKNIGFVPTMGALHDGHLSLIEASKTRCEVTVVSIFVNPTQFGPNEDLDRYPRSLETDQAACEQLGVDILFTPTKEEIYTDSTPTMLDIQPFSQQYCGQTRPQFFGGVLSVVLRLFNLVKPSEAFFGEKDYQQYFLIKKMTQDLFLPIKINAIPIKRDKNGLALSSRNRYLSDEDLNQAALIHQGLLTIKNRFNEGLTEAQQLYTLFKNQVCPPTFKLDYIAIVSSESLKKRDQAQTGDRVLCAVFFKNIRLIDNIPL